MREESPNFLTCPAFPELEPPKEAKVLSSSGRGDGMPRPPAGMSTDQHAQSDRHAEGRGNASPLPEPKRRRRRRYGRWIATALIAVILVATVPAGFALVRAYVSAKSAKTSLDRVKTSLQNLDAETAKAEMELARGSLGDVRDALQGVGFWRDIPGIGIQLRAMEDAVAAGAQTLDGASDLLNVVGVVTDALRGGVEASGTLTTGIAPSRGYEDLSAEEKRDLVTKFANALPDLRLARDKIDIALELWERVPQNQLVAPLRNALQPVAEILPKLKQGLDEGVPLIEVLVPMAGYPNKVRYLLLLQNSDELRPGGGFIGNIGTMTLDAGDMSELEIVDVYNVDTPAAFAWKETPPKQIAERLGVKYWFLRDANWSPDFPSSAERQLDFYKREVALGTGKPVTNPPTAVIALEPAFFKALLQLTGPIVLEGTTFTKDNFFDQLQYEAEQGWLEKGIPVERRKELVGKLGEELANKVKSLPASRWNEIIGITTKALERKQIMMYAQDPNLLSILDTRGWTARAKPTNGDFLWVIDANLGAYKTDGKMDKQITYALDARDPAHPKATVTLKYRNTVERIDWRYTRYRSYTRVYVPEGAKLISSSGAMKDDRYKTGGVFVAGPVDVTKELGKTVFGAFWSIEPRQTGTLSFTYELPASSFTLQDSGSYHLDWPKQAGADNSTLTLDLSFGKTIKSATPPEDNAKWGNARYEYETDSLQDREFTVKF